MTIATGTQKQIDSATGTGAISSSLTESTFICFYTDNTEGLQAVHCTITNGVITLGTPLTVDSGTTGLSLYGSTKLSSTKTIIVYRENSAIRAYVVSASGTTLSKGALKTLTDLPVGFVSIDAISSAAAILVYTFNASSDGKARILSVSGTTITENAAFAWDDDDAFNAYGPSVAALSSTQAIVAYYDFNDSYRPYAQVLDISGTTITGNTNYQIHTAGANASLNTSIAKVSTTSFVFLGNNTTTLSYARQITVSGTVLSTPGSVLTVQSGGLVSNNLNVVVLSASKGLVHLRTQTTSNSIYEIGISGSILTRDDTMVPSKSGDNGWVTGLNSTLGVMVWKASTEALPISISTFFSGYDLILGGGLP